MELIVNGNLLRVGGRWLLLRLVVASKGVIVGDPTDPTQVADHKRTAHVEEVGVIDGWVMLVFPGSFLKESIFWNSILRSVNQGYPVENLDGLLRPSNGDQPPWRLRENKGGNDEAH